MNTKQTIINTQLKTDTEDKVANEYGKIWNRMSLSERSDLFTAVLHYTNAISSPQIREVLTDSTITGIHFGKNLVLSRSSADCLANVRTVYFTGYKDLYYRGKPCNWVNIFEKIAEHTHTQIEWYDPALMRKPMRILQTA